jgi:hypothetical protein
MPDSDRSPIPWLARLLAAVRPFGFVLVFVFVFAAAAVALAPIAEAHEVPEDVRVVGFLSAGAERTELLLRVPLSAMREADLPWHGPGYLALRRAAPALRTAVGLWLTDNIVLTADGAPLPAPRIEALRVSLASDRSFTERASARAALRGPALADDLEIYWKQPFLDVALDYRGTPADARLAIDARLARLGLRVSIVLHSTDERAAGRPERTLRLHGDEGPVALDPTVIQAASRFAVDGFRHILDGADHLLFLACLVLPMRRAVPLVAIVTAFTIAHSITLASAALGWTPRALWFAPLVEWLIALSILVLALENLIGIGLSRRWRIAFAFGLVHGFGFAFALAESLQFAGRHLAVALLSFNLGVELGQLLVLAIGLPLLDLVLKRLPQRPTLLVLSALIAHTAWHWVAERWQVLARFPWPTWEAAGIAEGMRWLAGALVLGLIVWLAERHVAGLAPTVRRTRSPPACCADPRSGSA